MMYVFDLFKKQGVMRLSKGFPRKEGFVCRKGMLLSKNEEVPPLDTSSFAYFISLYSYKSGAPIYGLLNLRL